MRRTLIVPILVALGSLACSDPASPDAGTDAGACETPAALEVGALDGRPDALRAGPGEARAGRLSADDVPDDPRGLSAIRGHRWNSIRFRAATTITVSSTITRKAMAAV